MTEPTNTRRTSESIWKNIFPTELRRLPFLLRWIMIYCITQVFVAPVLQIPDPPLALLLPALILVIILAIYAYLGMFIPRVKNAGFSPWLLLLLLVPVANLFVLIVLFFLPPKAVLPMSDRSSELVSAEINKDPPTAA